MNLKSLRAVSLLAVLMPCGAMAQTWNDFETAPHNYWDIPPQDAATRLQERMVKKEITLPADSNPRTFLAAYLKALDVPVSSQIFVFSRSSLQRDTVRSSNPRALYFNDDTYVGWMPGGKIEVTSIDPVLGGVFYIFNAPEQSPALPDLDRSERCMGCHAGGPTNYLPGLMARSLFTDRDGNTGGEAGPSNGGHHAPFEKRWGGWFISGEMAGMKHVGNTFAGRRGEPLEPAGPLEKIVPPGTHLKEGSDPVALLLHDHQVMAVNILMEANYRLRTILHKVESPLPVDQRAIPEDGREAAEEMVAKLLRFMLFATEVPLPGQVTGGEEFPREFAAARRADEAGRSLRDLDMQSRLLKYRCSYMIYSAAWKGMPAAFRMLTLTHLRAALESGAADSPAAHLPAEERAAISAILKATLPEYSLL